jgi:hypothetical protein
MLSKAMKVCMEHPLSGQCLCPGLANFGGKYFLFPAILVLGSTGFRFYSLILIYICYILERFREVTTRKV